MNGLRQAFSTRFVEAPFPNNKGARCASSGVGMGGGGEPPNVPTKTKTDSLHVTSMRELAK